MTPERWQRTEELYHAARARPPGEREAFLAEACPDDDALRREVASLLGEASDAGFLAQSPLAAAMSGPSDPARVSMTDRVVGGYHLQALLGAGGMGEVYRAHDSKLGRDVAIKVLPQAFTGDADRLARLEREARMLAALNHPNICGIYGLDDADGVRFLVLELVDGKTLAQILADRLRRGASRAGLPLADALAIARQTAEALEVAHERGIVHRDLKPANITITPDGLVKVLDFGLAKTIGAASTSPDLSDAPPRADGGRRDGAVIGTAAYMSPEQARGQPVDRRTDVWAFGCVLYEMLTGRVPFPGATVSDTIAKILEREPDWSALPPATPASVRRLLRRCLTKDPKQRLRDIGDARIECDAIDETPSLPAASRTAWLPWAAVAALLAGVGVWEARRPIPSSIDVPPDPLRDAQFSRITDWDGDEGGADLSPDGRFVLFLGNRARPYDIWQGQLGTARFVNLTSDVPPLGPPSTLQRSFGFSRDGAEVWYGANAGRKVLIPLTGGAPRPFLGELATSPSWSPDGSRVVYVSISPTHGDALSIADGTGADARPLVAAEKKLHNHNPVWSPDGQWIYFVRGTDPTDVMDVWRVRSSGGSAERVTERSAPLNFIAPLDARTLLYVGRAHDWSGPWLWSLDVETRAVRRATVGLEHYTSVSASRDGRRVVATRANPTASLWRVPLRREIVDERDAEAYAVPTFRALAPRFGGSSLFYLSTSGPGDGLWRVDDASAFPVTRGQDGVLFEPPAVSRDGRRLTVQLRKDARRYLAIMSADGTDVRTLAASINVKGTADWSPDGTSVATGGIDPQGEGLFLIPVDGNPPVRLVAGQAFNPVWSPKGDLIVYADIVGGGVPLLGVAPDGTAVEMPSVAVRPGGYRFLPDGSGLVYLPGLMSRDFWLLDFATRKTRQLTRLGVRGAVGAFDVTPDGQYIVFDRSRENSDVVLIDLPK